MAWSLCDKEDVVAVHPIPASELRDEWSEMVEALIRQHMDTPYLGKSQTITNEYHNGDGTNLLRVAKPPIMSLTSLYINEVPLTASDYVVFDSYIELKAQTFPDGVLNVQVSYISGTSDVDDVVRLAAVAMVIAIINYRKSWGSDASLKWGDAEQRGERSPNYNVGLTSHLQTIMKRLLRRDRLRVR